MICENKVRKGKMIELSICIPSYNRFHVLKRNILSILTKTKSMDFEVVIIDNQSPKDVIQTLDITDKRLRIIKRNVPVSGTENVNQCVLYARGKYALLCLDKDYIDGGYLDDFISCLKNHNDIKGGICPVFSKKNGHLLQKFTNRVIEKKTDLLIHFGYTKKHPSGNFYLTECVKRAYQYSLSEEEKKIHMEQIIYWRNVQYVVRCFYMISQWYFKNQIVKV